MSEVTNFGEGVVVMNNNDKIRPVIGRETLLHANYPMTGSIDSGKLMLSKNGLANEYYSFNNIFPFRIIGVIVAISVALYEIVSSGRPRLPSFGTLAVVNLLLYWQQRQANFQVIPDGLSPAPPG